MGFLAEICDKMPSITGIVSVTEELGWPWVFTTISAPLLPAACVAAALLFVRRGDVRRGFPIAGK